jgi:predicted anti-sigma-YlaC factor YlaD
MNCETARRLLTQDEPDTGHLYSEWLARHLSECAACRLEAAFAQRIAAAVAAMPREQAPPQLVERVMAQIRPQPEPTRVVRRPYHLVLRPWELGWLAALCLLMVVLASRFVIGTPWSLAASTGGSGAAALTRELRTWLTAAGHWPVTALTSPETWRPDLSLLWRGVGEPGMVAAGTSMTWVGGAVAFALALYLLLTWRPTAGAVQGREDALV